MGKLSQGPAPTLLDVEKYDPVSKIHSGSALARAQPARRSNGQVIVESSSK